MAHFRFLLVATLMRWWLLAAVADRLLVDLLLLVAVAEEC